MSQLFNLSTYTSKFLTGPLAIVGAVVGAALGFLFGSIALFYVFTGLLALDFATGVFASWKTGQPVNSKRMQGTTYKLIAYLSVICVAAFIGVTFPTLGWLTPAAIGWITLGESVSILENCERMLGRPIPFLIPIRRLLDAMKGYGPNG